MAKPDLGTKRQCLSCGSKYYDLGKDPAVCPRCGTIYQPAVALRSRAEAKVVDEDEEVEVEIDAPELISLEEAEVEESEKDPVIDDVEIDDDIDADDDFLAEEEEGDDDVSALIDGDLQDDEES
ncbi:MAG: TIGR02300 family protein [Beijerinckiaceae bacterium]